MLTPEDIANTKFPVAFGRGYEQRAVDAFVAEVASAYKRALESAETAGSEAAPEPFEVLGQEVSNVLRVATTTAEEMRAKAEQEADAIRRQATEKGLELRRQAEAEAAARRDKSVKESEQLLKQTEARASRLKESTERQCSDILAEAVTRHESLKRHEQEIRQRIEAVEVEFRAFRAELESQEPAKIMPAKPGDVSAMVDVRSDSEKKKSPWPATEVTQPRPMFDNTAPADNR
ncbi:MAG: DivIVA domain-containing protein [Actinobacteria bacterium]|nr:DivIVA domain-containing protein [Actinomycetota bacterium]